MESGFVDYPASALELGGRLITFFGLILLLWISLSQLSLKIFDLLFELRIFRTNLSQ